VTVPVVVLLGLLIGNLSGSKPHSSAPASDGALAPVSVAAPPPNAAADASCTALLGKLPISLPASDGALTGRPAQSTWTYVAAWGQPAVVLRCGVPRPAELVESSGAFVVAVDGVNFLPAKHGEHTVYTSIDRAAYVEITVPSSYHQPPLGAIADAISASMKAVCVVDPNETDVTKLCTHRP
jgi:Protein of unknown function (DUF3515)